MLLEPSITEIKEKADSRYTLVIMAAKRARDLIEGKPALVETDPNVPLSVAAKEILDGEITYKRPVPAAAAAADDGYLDPEEVGA
ncbi:MAG: DNA-directed RNA polymerase subunit omega [Clostridiales Family XIII bacterium]|jgi:DNA-directed RNA polymerase subunit omega|nr:DNA-directed RNA polymerase subunit omega [Clostridiales Family XIII bacterium]